MTHKIDINVTFKTPETATLAFGLLHHAAMVVAQGCRQQLEHGMANPVKAAEFLEHCMQQPGMRDAVVALAGPMMQDALAFLSSSMTTDERPVVERTPVEVVRDGLVALGVDVPSLTYMQEQWSPSMLEAAAGWVLEVNEAKLGHAIVPTVADLLQRVDDARPDPCSSLALDTVEVDGHVLLRQPQSAAVLDEPTCTCQYDDGGRETCLVHGPAKPTTRFEQRRDAVWHMVSSNIIDGEYLPGVRVETRGDEWRVIFEGATMATGTDPAQVVKDGREAIRRATPSTQDVEGRALEDEARTKLFGAAPVLLMTLELRRVVDEGHVVYRIFDLAENGRHIVGESFADGFPIDAFRDMVDTLDWEHRLVHGGSSEVPQHRVELWELGGVVNVWGSCSDALAELRAIAEQVLHVEPREGAVIEALRSRPSPADIAAKLRASASEAHHVGNADDAAKIAEEALWTIADELCPEVPSAGGSTP